MPEPNLDPDALRGDLKNARERLCRQQTYLPERTHRDMLQVALDNIDRVGAFYCPDWSKHEMPNTALDELGDDGA